MAAVVLGAALFLAIQLLRWPEPAGLDQSLFACFGLWLPHGAVPYVDLWDSKPPAVYYTYALAFLAAGPGPGTIRLLDAAATAAGALLAAALARRLRPGAGPGAGVAYVLGANLPLFEGYWGSAQAESFIGPLVLGALLAALGPLRRAAPSAGATPPAAARRWLLAAGGMAGLCVVYKVPAAALLVPVPAALLAARRGRLLGPYTLGACLAPTLAVLLLWRQGALADLWEILVRYTPAYVEAAAPPAYWPAAGAAVVRLYGGCLFLGTAALLGVGALVRSGTRVERTLVGSWWILAHAAVWAQRQFAGYHFLLLLPPLAVLAGVGCGAVARAWRTAPRRWLALGLALALATAGAGDLARTAAFYAPDVGLRLGRLTTRDYLRHFVAGPTDPLTEIEAGQYVRGQTRPGQRILVWGLAPAVYYHSGRAPATRYIFHHLLLTEAPLSLRLPGLAERRARFMQRLQADPPAWVLVGHGDRNYFEPQESWEQLERFPQLRAFVEGGYRYDRTIGHFVLYRRTTEQ